MRIAVYSLTGLIALLAFAWLIGPRLLVSSADDQDPRSEVYAAKLGKKIYTAGGIGFYRTLSSCAVFDAASREWSICAKLPRALHHVAMAASEDRIYASGGYSSLPFSIDRDGAVFALDPAGGEWAELARLPHPLGQHTMTYHDGALYLVGGDDGAATLDTLWRFDLANNAWTKLAPMHAARHSHAVALGEDALYVTGGRSAEFATQSVSAETYDFASGEWSRLPDLPEPLAGHGSVVIGGKLHIYGGENLATGIVHTRHDILDLAKGEWTSGPALPEARHGFASADVDGTIWVLGGGRRYGMWTPLSVSGTALPVSAE